MDRPQRASLGRYSESDWRESGSSPSVVVVGGDDLPFTRFLNFLVKLGMGIKDSEGRRGQGQGVSTTTRISTWVFRSLRTMRTSVGINYFILFY